VVALKYNEDKIFLNNFYSLLGGVSMKDLKKLEQEFLKYLDYRLYVDEILYNTYVNSLLEFDK
jgi:hypothetical protein